MNLDRIKDTIRKMLDLAADDAATEGEVRNALTFAQKLMDEHQLSEEDLPDVDNRLLEIERAECTMAMAQTGGKNIPVWEKTLASFVSKFTGVPCYIGGTSQIRVNGIVRLSADYKPLVARNVVFYGVTADAELARELFSELRVTLAAMARLKYGTVYRGSGREYCQGFVDGLASQLEVPKQNALVVKRNEVVAAKQARADAFLQEQGIKLKKQSARRIVRDDEAFEAGRHDGKRHQLSKQRRLT